MRTDETGRVAIQGFLGNYQISVSGGNKVEFELERAGRTGIDVVLPS